MIFLLGSTKEKSECSSCSWYAYPRMTKRRLNGQVWNTLWGISTIQTDLLRFNTTDVNGNFF